MRPPLAASAGWGLPKKSKPAAITGINESEKKRMSQRFEKRFVKKVSNT
jgi:hypothetical protein